MCACSDRRKVWSTRYGLQQHIPFAVIRTGVEARMVIHKHVKAFIILGKAHAAQDDGRKFQGCMRLWHGQVACQAARV